MDVAFPLAYSNLVLEHLSWVATLIQTHLCLIWGRDLKADLLLLRRECELEKNKFSSGSPSLFLNKEIPQDKAITPHPHLQENKD